MDIRFISTLTPDDEERIASTLLRAASAILDQTGLAYTLRIQTTSEKVLQHIHPPSVQSVRRPQQPVTFASSTQTS